jgi:hypothetical protein
MYLLAMGLLFAFGLACTLLGMAASRNHRELTLALAVPGVAALTATTLRIVVGLRSRDESAALRVAGGTECGMALAWIVFMLLSHRAGAHLAGAYWVNAAAFLASGIGALLASFAGRTRAGQQFHKRVVLCTGATLGVAYVALLSLGLRAWFFAKG